MKTILFIVAIALILSGCGTTPPTQSTYATLDITNNFYQTPLTITWQGNAIANLPTKGSKTITQINPGTGQIGVYSGIMWLASSSVMNIQSGQTIVAGIYQQAVF